jgi:leader peptidase (prepilin peptidase)/N-methyltransferase
MEELIMPLLIFVVGCIGGVLVNYMADVLPIYRRFGHPICQTCSQPIPIKDYILLRPCADCGRRTWKRRALVLVIMPITFLALWYFPNGRLSFFENTIIAVYFILVGLIDLEHRVILHPVSLIGAGIGFVLGYRMHGLIATLIGGAAGFAMMLVLFYFGGLFAKLMGKWRGEEIEEVPLGFGDVNLSGVLGLLLGWPGIIAGLFFAILFGGVFSGLYILFQKLVKRYQAFTAIPYAPFLLIGSALLLFIPK